MTLDGFAARHSRALDPATAVRFQHQHLQTTVYSGSQLLIRPTAHEEAVLATVAEAADHLNLDIRVNQVDERLREMARAAGITAEEAQPLLLRVDLLPRWDKGPVSPPDAWPVLQEFRNLCARYGWDKADSSAVQLDHLVTSHTEVDVTGTPYWQVPGTAGNPYRQVPGTMGTPYWQVPGTAGTPYWQVPGGGAGEYAAPGWGGRTPVSWVGPEPNRSPDEEMAHRRRPVVALLDTGVGKHDWLPDSVVDRSPRCGELRIGLTDPHTAPEDPFVTIDPLVGGLDPTAGHGTFIAGLIRQKCPDANILAIRVIQGDGVVAEADLLEALNMLWLRQKLAIINHRESDLIDIVSLSLGYYHEELSDAGFDPFLLAPLRALGQLGVAVVASAGNDSTTRPMYPAAFAPWRGGLIKQPEAAELPIVSVGAHNPDGSVAVFSNEGPWVRVHRPGASLVSTFPQFDNSRAPSLELRDRGQVRSTIDPDDFRSGFGTWSGTSFAAPILVGEIAEFLNNNHLLESGDLDPAHAVTRGWKALEDAVPSLRRPRRTGLASDRPVVQVSRSGPTHRGESQS